MMKGFVRLLLFFIVFSLQIRPAEAAAASCPPSIASGGKITTPMNVLVRVDRSTGTFQVTHNDTLCTGDVITAEALKLKLSLSNGVEVEVLPGERYQIPSKWTLFWLGWQRAGRPDLFSRDLSKAKSASTLSGSAAQILDFDLAGLRDQVARVSMRSSLAIPIRSDQSNRIQVVLISPSGQQSFSKALIGPNKTEVVFHKLPKEAGLWTIKLESSHRIVSGGFYMTADTGISAIDTESPPSLDLTTRSLAAACANVRIFGFEAYQSKLNILTDERDAADLRTLLSYWSVPGSDSLCAATGLD